MIRIVIILVIICLLTYLYKGFSFNKFIFYLKYRKIYRMIKEDFYEKLSKMDNQFEIDTLGLPYGNVAEFTYNEAMKFGYNKIKTINGKIIFIKTMEE